VIKLLFCLCVLIVFIVFYAIETAVNAGKKVATKVRGKAGEERFVHMVEAAYENVRGTLENTCRICAERGADLSSELDVNDLIIRPTFQSFFNTYPAEEMVKIATAYCFYKQANSENVRDTIYAAAVPLIRDIRQRGEAWRLPEAWGGTIDI